MRSRLNRTVPYKRSNSLYATQGLNDQERSSLKFVISKAEFGTDPVAQVNLF